MGSYSQPGEWLIVHDWTSSDLSIDTQGVAPSRSSYFLHSWVNDSLLEKPYRLQLSFWMGLVSCFLLKGICPMLTRMMLISYQNFGLLNICIDKGVSRWLTQSSEVAAPLQTHFCQPRSIAVSPLPCSPTLTPHLPLGQWVICKKNVCQAKGWQWRVGWLNIVYVDTMCSQAQKCFRFTGSGLLGTEKYARILGMTSNTVYQPTSLPCWRLFLYTTQLVSVA